MAIPPGDLELWAGNESVLTGDVVDLALTWQARHIAIQEIISQGILRLTVAKRADIIDAWDSLMVQAQQQLENMRAFHEPIVGGWSLWDVNLIFDGWLTDGEEYEHPISGTIPGPIPATLVGRLNAILAAVAPPPLWFWSDSPGVGQVRVKCVAVPGADSYNVYGGTDLLGNVPDHTWNTLAVPVGEYEVRMGAVISGAVGIMSFPLSVEVV